MRLDTSEQTGVGVVSFGYYLPPSRLSVEELAEKKGMDHGKYEKIGCRHIHVAEDEEPSDMAVKATKICLEKAGADPLDVDMVIYCGSLKDYQKWQAASKVMHETGMNNAFGFDVYQGCNGENLSLNLAKAQILANPHIDNVLIVSADKWGTCTEHHILDSTYVFGDGASAALVRRGHERNVILSFAQKTCGRYHALYAVEAGGTKMPPTFETLKEGRHLFRKLDSPKTREELMAFVDIVNTTTIWAFRTAAERAGISLDGIDVIIVPNASRDQNRKFLEMMGFSGKRSTIEYVAETGHTGASDIFYNYGRALEEGMIREGDIVAIYTGGGGFTWSATILRS
ncbi:3-oxoacyl-[acyl-carrier-protein] synthase III C-terminal domain-containing protein [Thermodesulfobacteriota bacterium]